MNQKIIVLFLLLSINAFSQTVNDTTKTFISDSQAIEDLIKHVIIASEKNESVIIDTVSLGYGLKHVEFSKLKRGEIFLSGYTLLYRNKAKAGLIYSPSENEVHYFENPVFKTLFDSLYEMKYDRSVSYIYDADHLVSYPIIGLVCGYSGSPTKNIAKAISATQKNNSGYLIKSLYSIDPSTAVSAFLVLKSTHQGRRILKQHLNRAEFVETIRIHICRGCGDFRPVNVQEILLDSHFMNELEALLKG